MYRKVMETVGKLAASRFQKWYCGVWTATGSGSNRRFRKNLGAGSGSGSGAGSIFSKKSACHFLNFQCTEKLWVPLESWQRPGSKNGIAGSGRQPEAGQIGIFQQFGRRLRKFRKLAAISSIFNVQKSYGYHWKAGCVPV